MNVLIALNKKNEMVTAGNNLCKTGIFYCPSCKGRVCLKAGHVKRPHFAHYQNEACRVFSEGESEEHLEGKLQLATYLKITETNVRLEAYLPELQQRPDILFEKDHRKIVIEFQCSSISIESIMERTQGYLHANYEVIWILGNQFNYSNALTAFHKACLYSSFDSGGLMLIHYDAYTDRLLVRYDFQLLRNGQMSCQMEQLNLNERKVLKLAGKKKSQANKKAFRDIERFHQQFMREVRYPNPKMQVFLELIYQNKETIVSIPKEIYGHLPSEWMIQTHPMNWKYRFILWLESFPKKKILTIKMLDLWIDEQVLAKLLIYYKIPRVKKELHRQPFLEWIELLEKRKNLKKIGHLKWSYQQPLKRYKNLEEKFKRNS